MWNKGFSLLELLIILVLLSLLSVFAYTSYQSIMQKARRLDAHTTLLHYQVQMQKCFITEHDYALCAQQFNLTIPQRSLEHFYQIKAINLTKSTYILQAIAQGIQEKDKNCYRFTVDHMLQPLAYDQTGNPHTSCW